MDKKTLKLSLVQKLLLTENDEMLERVNKILEGGENTLSKEHKKELDERKKRHLSGKSRSYTWDEVKSLARQAMRK